MSTVAYVPPGMCAVTTLIDKPGIVMGNEADQVVSSAAMSTPPSLAGSLAVVWPSHRRLTTRLKCPIDGQVETPVALVPVKEWTTVHARETTESQALR